jgi:hypothetical protein
VFRVLFISTTVNKGYDMNKLPVLSFENADLCGPCGGKCCKSYPGAAMPHDFGASAEEIKTALIEALGSGRWVIDWWECDPRPGMYELPSAYFVRPAVVGGEGEVFHALYNGRCTFHTDTGCGIFDRRPSGCRGVEPGTEGCKSRHSSKRDAAIAWIPFRKVIQAAVKAVGK